MFQRLADLPGCQGTITQRHADALAQQRVGARGVTHQQDARRAHRRGGVEPVDGMPLQLIVPQLKAVARHLLRQHRSQRRLALPGVEVRVVNSPAAFGNAAHLGGEIPGIALDALRDAQEVEDGGTLPALPCPRGGGCDHLQQTGAMEGLDRDDGSPRDPVGAVRPDDDSALEGPLVGLDLDALRPRLDVQHADALAELHAPASGMLRQPGIELIAADESQAVSFFGFEVQPPAGIIEMDSSRVHVRDPAHIQAQVLQDGLGVHHQPSRAQLGARVMGSFQHQEARDERGVIPGDVQGGGKTRRSRPENQDVARRHAAIKP